MTSTVPRLLAAAATSALLSLVFGVSFLTASAGGATTALVGTGFEDAMAARSFWTLLSGCEFRTVACACRALASLALGTGMAFARGGCVCAAGAGPGVGLTGRAGVAGRGIGVTHFRDASEGGWVRAGGARAGVTGRAGAGGRGIGVIGAGDASGGGLVVMAVGADDGR
jgi:hypothetical protein